MRFIFFQLVLFLFSLNAFGQAFSEEEKLKIINHNYEITSVTTDSGLAILNRASQDIDVSDPLLPELVGILIRMCVREEGVGIAAPQIGINRNVFLIQRFDEEGEPFQVFINPKIKWASDLYQKGPEGCLSIPDFRDELWRHYAIQVSYYSLSGEYITEVIEGFTAVIFQHEFDHLQGRLITDSFHQKLKEKVNVVEKNFGQFK